MKAPQEPQVENRAPAPSTNPANVNLTFPFGLPNTPNLRPPSYFTAHFHARNSNSNSESPSVPRLPSIVNTLDSVTSRPFQVIPNSINFSSRNNPETSKLIFPLTDNNQREQLPSRTQKIERTEHISSIPQSLSRPLENLPSNRFVLLEQPHEVQRKSYGSENRCLLPNPLTISLRSEGDERNRVLDGIVSVRLGKQLIILF